MRVLGLRIQLFLGRELLQPMLLGSSIVTAVEAKARSGKIHLDMAVTGTLSLSTKSLTGRGLESLCLCSFDIKKDM